MKKALSLMSLILSLSLALSLGGCAASADNKMEAAQAPSAAPNVAYDGGDRQKMAESFYDDAAAMPEVDLQEEMEMDIDDVAEEPTSVPESGGGLVSGGGEVAPLPPDMAADQPRKIVYTVDLSLQTTEFDRSVEQIPQVISDMGGFVQDSYVQGTDLFNKYYARHASFTARVPVDKLDNLLDNLAEGFHVVYQQKSSSDISGNYYDTKARLDSLQVQRERLMEMLKSSDELQYLLEVERELANVLYEIEAMTSALRRMDSSVDLSTVSIQLQEVSAYGDQAPVVEPATFSEQARETIADSWKGLIRLGQGFVLLLIALVPYLPLLVIAAVVVVVLLRKRRKSKAGKIAPPAPDAPALPDEDGPVEP